MKKRVLVTRSLFFKAGVLPEWDTQFCLFWLILVGKQEKMSIKAVKIILTSFPVCAGQNTPVYSVYYLIGKVVEAMKPVMAICIQYKVILCFSKQHFWQS